MKISLPYRKVSPILATLAQDKLAEFHATKNGAEIGFGDMISLDDNTPKEVLVQVLETVDPLTEKQRGTLHQMIHGVSATLDMLCAKPSDVHTMISSLKMTGNYNAEMELCGRWYPVQLASAYAPARDNRPSQCNLTVIMKAVDYMWERNFSVISYDFEAENGAPKRFTGKEILEWFKLKHLEQDVSIYEARVSQAKSLSTKTGSVVGCTHRVLTLVSLMYSRVELAEIELGSKGVPKKVVVEPELETTQGSGHSSSKIITNLPFVRAFSLDLKRYVYIDIEDTIEYKFDDNALNWLVLPSAEKDLLTKLFTSARDELFGDVLQDKHGGMIILANGGPGVGKTLTAEVFAEVTHAPLYVMEMAELGINVEKIEENLMRVFRRVTRWNAILLLDEADIFLAKRGEDLERSVIVGIFLRLMDYYRGLLFLTSNRSEAIDAAFKSRITVSLNYPTLDDESRGRIWRVMLQHAAITLIGDLCAIAKVEINGRQIRNITRLIKVLYGSEVTVEQVLATCQFICK